MRPAFLKLARCLALLAVFLLGGGHMAVWQGVAWVRMVADYAQETSIARAVVETFDGNHACPMCRAVERENNQQKQPATQLALVKVAMIYVATDGYVFTTPAGDRMDLQAFHGGQRTERPPTPPPRVMPG